MEFRRDSRPAICDAHSNRIGLMISFSAPLVGKRQHLAIRPSLPQIGAGADANLATDGSELHGIIDQVRDDVLQFQQIVTRALGIWGLVLVAEAFGLATLPALVVAAQ